MAKKDLKQIVAEIRKLDVVYSSINVRFKPEFGNEKHIYLARDIGKLGEMRKELKKKMKEMKGGAALAEEILAKEKSIISQLNLL